MGLDLDLYKFNEAACRFVLLCSGYDGSNQMLLTIHKEALRLGLPPCPDACDYLGGLEDLGELINEPAIDYPKSSLHIGAWQNLTMTCGLLKHLTHRTIYDLVPEASGNPDWVLTDWHLACNRVESAIDFVADHGDMLTRMKREGGIADDFEEFVHDLHVIRATLRYPIEHEGEYLLRWSA